MKTLTLLATLLVLACLPIFAGIPYSGTVRQTDIAADDAPTLINNLHTELVTAGWTNISGSTGNWIVQTASTPNSNQIQLNLYNNSGTASFKMRNVAGTKVATSAATLPVAAAKVYRCISGKYQFACFTIGTTGAGEFLLVSSPYVPPNLAASTTGDLGIVWAGSSLLRNTAVTWANLGFAALVNNNFIDVAGTSCGLWAGSMKIPFMLGDPSTGGGTLYRWGDDSGIASEAPLGWGLTSCSDEAKLRVLLWDATLWTGSYTQDTTYTLDSKSWYAMGSLVSTAYRQTFMLAVVP